MILLHGVLSPSVALAQVPDTVFGRHYQYYYGKWYDECDRYLDCMIDAPYGNYFYLVPNRHREYYRLFHTNIVARRFTVPGRMAIKGMVALASGQKKAEYLMLFQHDTTAPGNTAFLGMTRWDTAERKVMKLPQCIQSMNLGDNSKFLYVDAYEAFLEKPLVVDSVFYIAGTFYSDTARITHLSIDVSDTLYSSNTIYYSIQKSGLIDCDSCLLHTGDFCDNNFPVDMNWIPRYINNSSGCGMFLAIIDSSYYQLTVLSDSVPMGTVAGGGHYVSMTQVQISATPEAGYRFAMWNDGSTENPRTVEVYCDTVFTALFTGEENYVVRVESNRPAKGSVSGGGIYTPGQTAVLQATVTDSSYRFMGWSDGDTVNPRMVMVDSDSSFTALFSSPTGIGNVGRNQAGFSLSPNPSHDRVTLTTQKEGLYSVAVFDNNGRQVASASFIGTSWSLDVSNLADGTYYISLRSENGDGVKTFVKQ